MKKIAFLLALPMVLLIYGSCKGRPKDVKSDGITKINAAKAKELMEKEGVIVVDVRTKEEYDSGHIPSAILLPNEEISTAEIEILPNKEQMILVYCRSGGRSNQAAQKLVKLGYTNVYDFGGIIDWPYETE